MRQSGSRSSHAGLMDATDLSGSSGKSARECGRQDRTSLRNGSNTPTPRCQTSVERSERVCSACTPGARADIIIRRSKLAQTICVAALAGLIGLTSWAIASVSTWLVAVYASVMVLIFALPRAQSADGENHRGEDDKYRDQAKRWGKAQDRALVDADLRDCATLMESSPAGILTSGAPPSSSAARAIARARSRVRKAGRIDCEPSLEPTFASWHQVAPGKFVRADAQDPRFAGAPEPHAPLEAHESSVNEAERRQDEQVDQNNPTALTAPDASCHEGPGLVLGDPGCGCPQDWPGSDGPAELDCDRAERSEGIREAIRHPAQNASPVMHWANRSPQLRNVSFGSRRRGSVESGFNADSCRRALRSRPFGRFSRTRGNARPRAPPPRS
jgi:hypothetical protein